MSDYSLKINLNDETASVDVAVREKIDGEYIEIDSQSFGLAGVHEDIRPKSDLYGLSKLLQDRSSSVPTGPDKLSAMNDVFAQLADGQWEKERVRGAIVVSAEVQALSEIKGVDIATIQKSLKAYTSEQKEAIFAKEVVVAKVKEIRARREETPDVDLSDMAA